MLITLKKWHVWVFLDRGEQGDGNETGLKEAGGIEMENYRASIHYYDNYNLV